MFLKNGDSKGVKTMPKEYIEREALIAEYDRVHIGVSGGARKLMVEAPTADVVEVVRCGECIHHSKAITPGRVICDKHAIPRNKTDFCSDGRRDKV